MDVQLAVTLDVREAAKLERVARQAGTTGERLIRSWTVGGLAAKAAENGGAIRTRKPRKRKAPAVEVVTPPADPRLEGVTELRLRAAIMDADTNYALKLQRLRPFVKDLPRGIFHAQPAKDGSAQISVQVSYRSLSKGATTTFSGGVFPRNKLVGALRRYDYLARLLQGKYARLHYPQAGEMDIRGRVVV